MPSLPQGRNWLLKSNQGHILSPRDAEEFTQLYKTSKVCSLGVTFSRMKRFWGGNVREWDRVEWARKRFSPIVATKHLVASAKPPSLQVP